MSDIKEETANISSAPGGPAAAADAAPALQQSGNATEGDSEDNASKGGDAGASGAGAGSKRERRKIEIKFIQEKSRRHITFSKRKAGIMKKAYELSVLTGTQVLLLVVSETGLVYTFTTPKLQPLVTRPEGKNLIQACLNAPEEPSAEEEEQVAAAAAAAQQPGAQQPGVPQQVPGQQPPHPQSQLPPPPHQNQYGVPMAGGYLNPGDQSSYYMGFNGNQGYN